jgi:hypothetical protein
MLLALALALGAIAGQTDTRRPLDQTALATAIPLLRLGMPLQQPPPQPADLALFPEGYRNHDALTSDLQQLAARYPARLSLQSLGRSVQDRDLWLARIGPPESDSTRSSPAVLIAANLEADHLVGSEVSLRLIERLAALPEPDAAKLPVIYIVPRLNPDGAEILLAGPTRRDHRQSLQAIDRDRDGSRGEDGPDDLDGDGLSMLMRAQDRYATLIADEKDARILRPADKAKGETPTWSLYREGLDNDGDGRIDEDPPGGVNLNRNWPHGWSEFDPETGYSPCAEPETRALIRFIIDHPEIAVIWTFSLNDSLATEPKKPDSTLDAADLPYFAALHKKYAALAADAAKAPDVPVPPRTQETPRPAPRAAQPPPRRPRIRDSVPASTRTPGLDAPSDGALSEWAYHQFGAVGIATRLWTTPHLPDPPENEPKPPADGDARWLYWNDKVAGARAFVAFHPFDHPTLGPVEIGGWKPGVRLNPPAARLAPLADAQFLFLDHLAAQLPRLDVSQPALSPKGNGLFEISAVVSNKGVWPTALAQGKTTRAARPLIAQLRAPGARLLAGRPVIRIDSLDGGGGNQEVRWLIQAPAELREVVIEFSCPRAGRITRIIPLR